jgi:phosphoglycerate dehydrogenase-like enzyme
MDEMNRSFVLVLSDGAGASPDPQMRMLGDLPHRIAASSGAVASPDEPADVLLHWSGSRDLLRAAFLANPGVRWVHTRSAGIDKILFPELVASAVLLTNGSGVFSPSLGEFALAAILYFAKDIRRLLRNQAVERWEQFAMEEVSGQTAGIVGFGDIGRAIATRLHAMGMQILALKRHAPAALDPLVTRFYQPGELNAMLGQCDYVLVSTPLTPQTHHMIGDAAFKAMKASAVVINVGRGPVIDQAALMRALSERRIRGAGLDVFEKEPIAPGDPIWKLDNVLISPHCADQTAGWLDRAMLFFLAQYRRFASGEPLQNIVDKRLGY